MSRNNSFGRKVFRGLREVYAFAGFLLIIISATVVGAVGLTGVILSLTVVFAGLLLIGSIVFTAILIGFTPVALILGVLAIDELLKDFESEAWE